MKIEKLSENQIRCTLNKTDLASRQLKISELAYGSEKAKELFRDMMQQASYELGFEADDIPLMIEAIPVSADCIVLIVTKVDDPEELDTRFSKFSPADGEDAFENYSDNDLDTLDNLDGLQNEDHTMGTAGEELNSASSDNVTNDVINLFSKVKDYLNKSISDIASEDIMNSTRKENAKPINNNGFVPLHETIAKSPANPLAGKQNTASDVPINSEHIVRIFSFTDLDSLTEAAKAIICIYHDINSLYKDNNKHLYYLTIEKKKCSSINFNKVCNILSEYGKKELLGNNSISYFKEHYECIIKNKAVQVMSKL
jgi:adapter protein MecA 1/2